MNKRLIVFLILSIAACGKKEDKRNKEINSTNTPPKEQTNCPNGVVDCFGGYNLSFSPWEVINSEPTTDYKQQYFKFGNSEFKNCIIKNNIAKTTKFKTKWFFDGSHSYTDKDGDETTIFMFSKDSFKVMSSKQNKNITYKVKKLTDIKILEACQFN